MASDTTSNEVTSPTQQEQQYPSSSASSAIIIDSQDNAVDLPLRNGKVTDEPQSAPEGSLCEAKNLYETKSDCLCCKNWVEELPDALKESPKEVTERARYALLVRHRKKHGEHKAMELDSIVVQSPELKPILAEIFEGFQGITTGLKNLTFRAPFKPFFYRWDRLQEALKQERDATATAHLNLLYNVIKKELTETIETHKDMLEHGVITFQYLWTMFSPGDLIYSHVGGQDRIFKLIDSNSNPTALLNRGPGYQLGCKSIDYDGFGFGYAQENLTIWPFGGTRPVSELEAYPIQFHPAQAALEEKLTKRGKVFESLQGRQYKAYNGPISSTTRWRSDHITQNLSGRIMIDAQTYASWSSLGPQVLASLGAVSFAPRMDAPDQAHSAHNSRSRAGPMPPGPPPPPPGIFDPPVIVNPPGMGEEFIEDFADGADSDDDNLTDEQLLLCTPYVKGYSLKTKEWAQFHVDHVEEIKWNDNAFSSLVLPGGYKELILSFVESQIANKDMFDDVIEGKGQGIVMLLHGEPGVGKTLTAESVSEQMRTPLYAISGGELGETAEQVEEKLNQILEIASKWDAVLLLDESDVFLEQRQIKDLERNKIVAIFLRMLEYYRGILFMTTNRVSAFDPAFKSRVHLTVRYPSLSEDARKQIWKNFIQYASDKHACDLAESDFEDLSMVKLNGREIKNVIKTAQLLAARQGSPLRLEHVRTVLKVTQEGGGFEGA